MDKMDELNHNSLNTSLFPESYMQFREQKLLSPFTDEKVPTIASFIHAQFHAMVMNNMFPCPGAKTAFSQGSYRYGVFDKMCCKSSTRQLSYALRAFIAERPNFYNGFTTFIASFMEKKVQKEELFTDVLWRQLQMLHDIDEAAWDPAVSSDPSSPQFSFSFGGCSFFVIGIHGYSPRYARRFAWPTLVFNAHEQFELLREKGDFEKFKEVVRKRDHLLQGSCNPILENHGHSSEAKQYSGDLLDDEWVCPFKHKRNTTKPGVHL